MYRNKTRRENNMSITAETAKAHAHDPAVLCCRAEAGITIEPANLEEIGRAHV